MENKLGLLKNNRIPYGSKDYTSMIEKKEKSLVKDSEKQESLFGLLESWLERTPFLSFKGFNFWNQYSKAVREMLKKEKPYMFEKEIPDEKMEKFRKEYFNLNM